MLLNVAPPDRTKATMNDTARSATADEVCGGGCQLHRHTGEISPVDDGMNEDPHHWHGRDRRQSAADEGCTRLAGIHPVKGYRDTRECAANRDRKSVV